MGSVADTKYRRRFFWRDVSGYSHQGVVLRRHKDQQSGYESYDLRPPVISSRVEHKRAETLPIAPSYRSRYIAGSFDL
jgi:hypothetical protein